MKYKVKTAKGAILEIEASSKGEAWATAKDCCDDLDFTDYPVKVKKIMTMKKELIFAMCWMLSDRCFTLSEYCESITSELSPEYREKAENIIIGWWNKHKS